MWARFPGFSSSRCSSGVVNAVLGSLLRILSLPVTFLTLGLFALVINAVLLWVTGAVAGSLGLGLQVDGFLPAFLGALVIGITRAVLNTVVDRRGRR